LFSRAFAIPAIVFKVSSKSLLRSIGEPGIAVLGVPESLAALTGLFNEGSCVSSDVLMVGIEVDDEEEAMEVPLVALRWSWAFSSISSKGKESSKSHSSRNKKTKNKKQKKS
jgi:hypothetical protein